MSTMEYRGQELLRKWLSGNITYSEELELFELAETDEMLKDALEGFIAQNQIKPISAANVKAWKQPVREEKSTKRVLSFVWIRYAAVILLLIGVGSILLTMNNKKSGVVADQFSVDIDGTELDTYEEVHADEVEINDIDTKTKTVNRNVQPQQEIVQPIIAEVENIVNEESIIDIIEEVAQIENPKIDDEAVPVQIQEATDLVNETIVEASDKDDAIDNTAFNKLNEVEKSFYEFEEDVDHANIGKKDDDLIKSFDYDIKSGVDPDEIVANGLSAKDSNSLNLNEAEVIIGNIDASGETRLEAKEVVPEVVVREYEFAKKDIVNPPIQDFNTMVKERYRRKAKPEIGYFKYKKYLRMATECLFEQYRNLDYLEESVLKFRVSKDGKIEFLEFFGINESECVNTVETSLANGPKWELLDFYESVDIEVPLKVLYPYIF